MISHPQFALGKPDKDPTYLYKTETMDASKHTHAIVYYCIRRTDNATDLIEHHLDNENIDRLHANFNRYLYREAMGLMVTAMTNAFLQEKISSGEYTETTLEELEHLLIVRSLYS